MPIYEFTCNKCKENFEELIYRSDEKVICPKCKGENIEKLISKSRHLTSNSSAPIGSSNTSSSGCSSCAGGNCSTCG